MHTCISNVGLIHSNFGLKPQEQRHQAALYHQIKPIVIRGFAPRYYHVLVELSKAYEDFSPLPSFN